MPALWRGEYSVSKNRRFVKRGRKSNHRLILICLSEITLPSWEEQLSEGTLQSRAIYGMGTETVGGYTWSYRVVGGSVEIWKEDPKYPGSSYTAVSPEPSGVLTIPSTLGGRPVTGIGNSAFILCHDMTGVKIPVGVTSIGGSAIAYCGLTSVTIPASVTNIGVNAFFRCDDLADMYFYADPAALTWGYPRCDVKEDGSTKIHVRAAQLSAYEAKFGDAVNATFVGDLLEMWKSGDCTVTLDDAGTLTVSGPGAMEYTSSVDIPWADKRADIKKVVVESGVTAIGANAFYLCRSLAAVTIPVSVTSIGEWAFGYCDKLTALTIPAKVTSIGTTAFYGCTSITDVYCQPNAADLIWYDSRRDFMSDKETKIHVRADQLSAYVANFGSTVNATFVGDLAGENFKVTFGKNGGTGGDNYVTATYGQPMPTPRTAPTLSGYTFGGYWDTLAMDEKGNPKGKQYYDANMKSVRSWDKASTATLWAKWTNKVTFGKNGGTGGDNYVTCTKGQPMPKRTMPTKSGYVFDGYWTTTGAGGVKYYNADGTSAHTWDKSGSVTLWAKWVKPVACKVTFGKNGGTGGDDYVTATTGQPMPTPRTAPTRAGWTFGGYWDTLACDASGNPLGKQYYDANMKSVRVWDKTSTATLWAKWTVRVKLGKNGGTGGDDYATVIYNQSFPKRSMPKRTGYAFGGYFVSASSRTGQCYNADGTGTASMKWSTGGTPTIWALWTKTSSCVEIPQSAAAPIASAASAAAVVAAAEPVESAIPAGLYSGVLSDGKGTFCLMLDEAEEGADRTAYLYVALEDGVFTAECTAEEVGGVLLLTTEDGEVYAFNPATAILAAAD